MVNEDSKILAAYETIQQAMIDKDIDKLDRIVKDGTTFVQSKSSGYIFWSGLTTIKRHICAQSQKYIMHITKIFAQIIFEITLISTELELNNFREKEFY